MMVKENLLMLEMEPKSRNQAGFYSSLLVITCPFKMKAFPNIIFPRF